MKSIELHICLPENIRDAAVRVGAQAEAGRYFAARGSHTTPARAKELLVRLGSPGELRDDDRLDVPDEETL